MIFCRAVSFRSWREIFVREFQSRFLRRSSRAARREVCHSDAVIQARRKRSAGDFAERSPSRENGVMRPRRRAFAFHAKGDKPSRGPFSFVSANTSRPMKFRFRQINKESEPGFDRIVFRRKIGAVERITHFQTQACRARRARRV